MSIALWMSIALPLILSDYNDSDIEAMDDDKRERVKQKSVSLPEQLACVI